MGRSDSTRAHQIACLAMFHSPILTIAANPQNVLNNPAVELIKAIPAAWEEAIVLTEEESELGKNRSTSTKGIALCCSSLKVALDLSDCSEAPGPPLNRASYPFARDIPGAGV